MFKCGHCGGEHPFVPHPSRPGRVVAYCNGRGVCERAADAPGADVLTRIPGIGPELAADLRGRGYRTLTSIDWASDTELLQVPGIGRATLNKMREWFLTRGGEKC
jgi:DNA integrity scanning protein DisA with diadenylate cyclase activity